MSRDNGAQPSHQRVTVQSLQTSIVSRDVLTRIRCWTGQSAVDASRGDTRTEAKQSGGDGRHDLPHQPSDAVMELKLRSQRQNPHHFTPPALLPLKPELHDRRLGGPADVPPRSGAVMEEDETIRSEAPVAPVLGRGEHGGAPEGGQAIPMGRQWRHGVARHPRVPRG